MTGLYFYDNDVVDMCGLSHLQGAAEITDINQTYLDRGELHVELMGRGYAWLDTGTHESLLEAMGLLQPAETTGCKLRVQRVAYSNNWITSEQLLKLAYPLKNQYGKYLYSLVEGKA